MSNRRVLALIVSATACLFSPALAAELDPVVEKQALSAALESYSRCNQACATTLAGIIVDSSVEEALDLISSIEAMATAANKKMRAALFYSFARRTFSRAENVVSRHGACAARCDQLQADIVTLGRAGLLGPLLRNGKVDPAIFENTRVLEVYLKYVKPVPASKLPWKFHNQNWWKKVQGTA